MRERRPLWLTQPGIRASGLVSRAGAGFQSPLPLSWVPLITAWTTVHWVTACRWNLIPQENPSHILRLLSIPQLTFPLLSTPNSTNQMGTVHSEMTVHSSLMNDSAKGWLNWKTTPTKSFTGRRHLNCAFAFLNVAVEVYPLVKDCWTTVRMWVPCWVCHGEGV